MRRIRGSRPSPAVIIAVLALVAAVAGTAIAADPVARTAGKTLTKKKVKKIANRQIDKRFPVGATELGPITAVQEISAATPNGSWRNVTATCPAGTIVISGGVQGGLSADGDWRVDRSRQDGNGWSAAGRNQSGSSDALSAFAYCLEA